jgi:acid stress-induced BolA-like protein IbaG/YrbA
VKKEEIKNLIEAGLPGAKVIVSGDDGQHFEADVIAPQFAGKTMIQQHRMVYATLGEKMGREIHALQLKTRAA